MPQASFVQTSFLGGEWSPFAQGRLEDKEYRAGMNVSLNGFPIETGLWTRRPGTRFCATTRYGQQAWLLPVFFAENQPYTLEFTDQYLRLFSGFQLAGTNDPQGVVSISTANPAVVTTASAHGWTSGNMVYFIFQDSQAYPGAGPLFLRQFVITVLSSTTFSIADPISSAGIDGSTISLPGLVAQVVRVQELSSPYTVEQLTAINKVQAEGTLVTLHPAVAPQALVQTTAPSASAFAQFSFNAANFIDGPYEDPNTTGSVSSSGLSGSVTISASGIAPFTLVTDVGRQIRLFSEPATWASGTAYTTGNVVKGPDGLYYTALSGSTGKQPDLNPTIWAINSSAAIWTWGTITAVASTTSATVTINGPALLYSGTAINTFRMGLYSATTGYPTCGIYHEGRLWLAGAQGNRIDASMNGLTLAAGTFQFSPTSFDIGTVSDNNAIAYVFNAEDVDDIFWLLPDNSGIVAGTQGGEWMIAASALNDPLTPTSIQAHRRSKYKCANIPATHAGLSLLFVQANQLRTIEYVADVFSGKFLGRNLNEKSTHLTTSAIEQIVYQQDKTPIVWERNGNGQLIGSTYKRESSFTSEPPTFNGWHEHSLGSTRVVESLSVGPSMNGDLESLTIVTNQTNSSASDYGVRHVEILTDRFDENNSVTDAWFLDDAVTPSAAVENGPPGTQVVFYGMFHLAGKTVTVFACGIDLGDYVVSATGTVTVPINQTGGQYQSSLFTDTVLSGFINSGNTYGNFGVPTNQTVSVYNPSPSNFNIQSYISSLITTTTGIVDDLPHNRLFSYWTGSGTSGGIAIFNRNTGAKIIDAYASTIMATTANQTTSNTIPDGPLILGSDGYLYCCSDSANSSCLRKINATNLNIVSSFGVVSGSFLLDNIHFPRISEAVSVNVNGKNYLIYTGLSSYVVSVIDVDRMSYAGHNFTYLENFRGQICLGEHFPGPRGYAAIYSVSCPAANSTTPAGIYKTVISGGAVKTYIPPVPPAIASNKLPINPYITTSRINTVSPSQVDATWSHFQTFLGPAYDADDGNLIFLTTTADAVTNTAYAVKVNSQSGSVIWACAIPNSNEGSSLGLTMSSIKNGLMLVMNGSTTTFVIVNTLTGTLVSSNTVPSVGYGTFNTSNDTDGSACSFGTWSGSTLVGVNGTVAFTGTTPFKVQSIPGFPGQTTQSVSGFIPAVIGFTYTSQGQLLRPQAPDATGARQGPGFGKTRRLHRYVFQTAKSQGLSVGTNFANMFPVPFRDFEGAPNYAPNVLFTGTVTDAIQDSYSYDGQLAWQITRPYPCNIVAAGAMIETQDR